MAKPQRPRVGEAVWDGARRQPGMQPNGTIIRIDYEWYPHTYTVRFEASEKFPSGEIGEFDFDDMEGNYTSKFGGVWLLNPEQGDM